MNKYINKEKKTEEEKAINGSDFRVLILVCAVNNENKKYGKKWLWSNLRCYPGICLER
jgi:hypothetical protein